MSTAHRPTWAPARGNQEQGGNRIYAPSKHASKLDMPDHYFLKYRQTGQSSQSEVQEKDLREELEAKELKHFLEKSKMQISFEEGRQEDLKLLQQAASKGGRQLMPNKDDADDEDPDADEDDSEEDSDEDEDALIQAELQKIKQERAEAAARKAAEEAERKRKEEEQQIIDSNPLLKEQLGMGSATDFRLKRRWDEGVTFRNQTRGEPKAQKRFINDTIRNDFHRRFLQRYVR